MDVRLGVRVQLTGTDKDPDTDPGWFVSTRRIGTARSMRKLNSRQCRREGTGV